MNDTRKRLDFWLRAALVWDAIFERQEPVTITEIAELCGLKRSPYLAEIVATLVAKGYLDQRLVWLPSGRAGRVYWTIKAPDWS